jgi:PKD repeat protein
MKFLYLFCTLFLFAQLSVQAQGLEGIIVERFYETDAADETNALDNGSIVPLPAGSVVYRVFVDMADGYKFSQIFGTTDHPLTVNATADFYNDPSYGVTVNPGTISANNIRKHTALIDSWFTTGGASNGKVGVLKIEDTDGSVGNQHGVLANNPGGCYGVPINGTNAQDGMTLNSPTTYLVPNSLGVGGALEALDQTAGNSVFIDGGAIAALGGIVGPTSTNRVMIAQFTVNGDITFALNVQLVNAATGVAENYVASNPMSGELTHPTLTYNSNIAPTISITSPANGSTIGFGNYMLTANANDEQGYVSAVEFFVDGVSVGSDNSAPFEVVYNATVGSHIITATAVDGDCLTADSQTINVTVSSNSAPSVTLDAPTIAVEGSPITLSSSASDSDGAITQVEFFVNGVSVGADASAPYSVVWTAALGTDQAITAVATDDSGLSTTSNVVLITVNANIAPTVSITFPFSTSDFTAPEMVALTAEAFDSDGTIFSVEFFVNGLSVGTANTAPFIVNWMSVAGPAEIVAVATDSNGAQTTSVSVNLEVLDPTTEAYAVESITQACNIGEFCVPISASAAFPVSGVIGYDITLNYDATYLEPTGSATLSDDMIDASYVNATVNTTAAGVVQVMITLNGSAPAGTQFQGYGDLVCVNFSRLAAFGAADSTEVSVSAIIESYVSGSVASAANAACMYSELNTLQAGNIAAGGSNALLTSNETTATSAPSTTVYAASNGTVNSAISYEVDAAGSFTIDVTSGTDVAIERAIDNTASIQNTVNGADVLVAKALLNGTLTPSVWQILALDVNLDGAVTAGDISQINQRATLMIGEYQQAWNYDNQGNSNGQPSKDWIFVDEARLNDAAFAISTIFPADDQIGFSAARVPAVPFVLPTSAVGFNSNSTECQQWNADNFKAILLGDANSSYGTNPVNAADSVIFDLSQAVLTNDGVSNFIEVPVIAQLVGSNARALDVAMKFNQNKLAYNTAITIATDVEAVANYNTADQYVRLTATRNTEVAFANGDVIAHIKFEILDDCAAVFSTDFNSISTWINGEAIGNRIIDGATPPAPIQIVSAAPYCAGSPIELSYSDMIDGSMITNYAWQFGDGTTATGQNVSVSITASGATPILLSLTAANGCSYEVPSEVFVSTSPVATFAYAFDAGTGIVTFDNNSTISAGSIASYAWNFGDTNSSTDADPTHTYAASGAYNVSLTATSAVGCSSTFELAVNASVGVEEMNEVLPVAIYPNPATNAVRVESAVEGLLFVLDQSGRKVMDGIRIAPNVSYMLDVATWAEGMYQVVLVNGTESGAVRLVKVN